ncbi:MAG: alpha/beta hydrolase [Pseudomonadota bacterium]
MAETGFTHIEIEPGRRVHACIEGSAGAPVILYDAGAYGIYADGWWLKEALKTDFRVCLYDRAGMGASDPLPPGQTPSPDWHAEEMVRLLDAIGVDGPIILVGHSMAGLRLHAFATLFPGHLRGLVFVDAVSPRVAKAPVTYFGHRQFNWIAKATARGASMGLADMAARFAPNHFKLQGKPRADQVAALASQRHHDTARDEVLAIDHKADYLDGGAVVQFPLAIFACTVVNGMEPADAEAARLNSGYGWYGRFPRENHMSILVDVYAEAIANRIRDIHHHTRAAVTPSA